VQVGVRIQAAALIARASTGPIGEAAAGFLDKEKGEEIRRNDATGKDAARSQSSPVR